MRVLLPVFCMLLSALGRAQIVPVDSVVAYAGKTITVFGRVSEVKFSESKRHDTTYFKLAGNLTSQYVSLIIYPGSRVGFGYKPESVLLNKSIYVSGTIEINNGVYQLEIKSPFDIAFSPAKFKQSAEVNDENQRQVVVAKGSNAPTQNKQQRNSSRYKPTELALSQDIEMLTKLTSPMQAQSKAEAKTAVSSRDIVLDRVNKAKVEMLSRTTIGTFDNAIGDLDNKRAVDLINGTDVDTVSKITLDTINKNIFDTATKMVVEIKTGHEAPLTVDTVKETLTPFIWETRVDTADSVAERRDEKQMFETPAAATKNNAIDQATIMSDASIKAGPADTLLYMGN